MLGIEMDVKVNKYLAQLGFNIKLPILYVPARHRDLSGHVQMGFRAVGEVTDDPKWLDHPLCNTTEHIIFRARTDMSLAKELARMLGSGIKFGEDDSDGEEGFPEALIEPDFEEASALITVLTAVRDNIRGTPYNDYGGLKTPAEYQMHEATA